jgi:hypothetical protein
MSIDDKDLVSIRSQEIVASDSTPIYSTAPKEICPEIQSEKITVVKKEYSVVGDGLFASIDADEAPLWLTAILNDLVTNAIANGFLNYDLLVQDVRNAIDSIDVAKNTYVEQINIAAIVNGIVVTKLETLNATLGDTYATRVALTAAVATTESAMVLYTTDLVSSFNDSVNARITNVEVAYSDADSALSTSIQALNSRITDQDSDLEAKASAISGLRTYVGLSTNNNPNSTGLLSRVQILENQNDGVVEYVSGTYDVMIGIEDPNTDTSNDELDTTAEPYATWIAVDDTNSNEEERQAHIGDVYIRYDESTGDYIRAYKFIKVASDSTVPFSTDPEGYTWSLITDTDAANALIIAIQAKDLADNKRRVFLVQPTAPYDEGDLWVDSSTAPQIIRVSTVARTSGYTAGDWVLADQQAQDFITNTYNPEKIRIENQIDGKIEYFFYNSFNDSTGPVNLSSAGNEAAALVIISNTWNTEALKDNANGNIVYFKDSKNAYWYQSRTELWLAIIDTSIYEALQDAATARGAADGKVSQFYAWSGSTAPNNYVVDGETIVGSTVAYWLKDDNILYYKVSGSWVAVPTSSNTGSVYVAEGDILTVYDPVTRDYTYHTFNGSGWQISGPTGIISRSSFFVNLDNAVRSETGLVATALSNLEISNNAYTDGEIATVSNSFDYNSTLNINGVFYNTGFGLNSDGSGSLTQPSGADGTSSGTAFDSEFWINAERFVLKSPSFPGVSAIFKVTAGGIQLGIENTEATRNEAQGAYSSGTAYVKGDIVLYNGSSYSALRDTTNDTPDSSPSDWQLFATKGDDGVSVTGASGAGFYGSTYASISWTTATATSRFNAIAGRAPVEHDIFTQALSDGSDSQSREFNGTDWVSPAFLINGSIIATDSLAGNRIIAGTEITSPLLVSANIRGALIQTIGTTHMIIQRAAPFGPNNLIQWYGVVTNNVDGNGDAILANLTKVNGIAWKDDVGNVYTSGTIIAGTLTVSKQTTELTNTPIISTGTFGSNGGQILINCSAFANFDQISAGNVCNSPPANPTVVIRLYNFSNTLVNQQTFTGSTDCSYDFETDESFTTYSVNGSFSYYDNEETTANRSYRAEATINNVPLNPINNRNQSLSILSQEVGGAVGGGGGGGGTSVPANDASITVNASSGLSGSGVFTVDQSADQTISLIHAAPAVVSRTRGGNNNSLTVVNRIETDSRGHVHPTTNDVNLLDYFYTESESDGRFLGINATATDSATLGGASPSQSNVVNTIAHRDGAGDIKARIFRPEYSTQNSTANFLLTQNELGTGDNYLRPISTANFIASHVRNTTVDNADKLGDINAANYVTTYDVATDGNFPFKSILLTGTLIGSSYKHRVILLVPQSQVNAIHANKIVGKITASKDGGNVFDTFDVAVSSVYNNTQATFHSTGQRQGHRFVTCDYNGVRWIAIEPAYTANPYNNLWFHGQIVADLDVNGDALKVIAYKDTQSGTTVLNAEINNSLVDYTGNTTTTTNGYNDLTTANHNGDSTTHDGRYGRLAGTNTWTATNTFSGGVIFTGTGTIGNNAANIGNGHLLVGSTSSGIGIDANELYCVGQPLNFGTPTGNDSNVVMNRGGNTRLTLTATGVSVNGILSATALSGPLTGNVTGNASSATTAVSLTTGAKTIAGNLTVGNTTSSNIIMVDTNATNRTIHCNDNRIGFLNSASNWSSYSDNAGNWFCDFDTASNAYYATGLSVNSAPTTDDARFGGYGILGNRGSFYVSNTGGDVKLNYNNVHGAATKLATTATGVTVTGTMSASEVTETSALKYKNITERVDPQVSLEKVVEIGKKGTAIGTLKDDETKKVHRWFIADEVLPIMPEVVILVDGEVDSLAYSRMLPDAYAAIAKQQEMIEKQSMLIEELMVRVKKLEGNN